MISDKLPKVDNTGEEPHRCPICFGRGNVSGGFYNGVGEYSVSNVSMEICRQCNGTGIIWS